MLSARHFLTLSKRVPTRHSTLFFTFTCLGLFCWFFFQKIKNRLKFLGEQFLDFKKFFRAEFSRLLRTCQLDSIEEKNWKKSYKLYKYSKLERKLSGKSFRQRCRSCCLGVWNLILVKNFFVGLRVKFIQTAVKHWSACLSKLQQIVSWTTLGEQGNFE